MDSKEHLDNLKRTITASIERARQNVEDLHSIENALQENLQRLRELRKSQSGSDNRPKQK